MDNRTVVGKISKLETDWHYSSSTGGSNDAGQRCTVTGRPTSGYGLLTVIGEDLSIWNRKKREAT